MDFLTLILEFIFHFILFYDYEYELQGVPNFFTFNVSYRLSWTLGPWGGLIIMEIMVFSVTCVIVSLNLFEAYARLQ